MHADIRLLFSAVEAAKDTVLAAERYIWEHPETGYREWNTHAYMKEKMEALGYTVTEAGNIPGFYTDVDTGRPGPRIGIFAEMDGLIVPTHPDADPQTGFVHACGHNCQCAAMLGIAAALRAPGALAGLSGSIRLIVVPAEELIELGYRQELRDRGIIRYFGGKQEFMHRGILEGVSMAFLAHAASNRNISCNRGSNGCIVKSATFHGKAAHAGTSPHMGINALYAATSAMQVANALRETFREQDTIRFHPIITGGGDSVNAVPDRVAMESYLRGASMAAMAMENEKINRAFAGAAAAMGCRVSIQDLYGYAPRDNNPHLRKTAETAAKLLLPEDRVDFTESWGTGCSDLGDVSCIMPAIHPNVGGCEGAGHSAQYRVADPYLACVVSAKFQVGLAALLLQEDAREARHILAQSRQDYPTAEEYLAQVDRLSWTGEAVTQNPDGTVTLRWKE